MRFLVKHGQAIRVAPDSVCGFVHGKAGVIERADGQKVGFIGLHERDQHGWQRHYEILWEDDVTRGRGLDRGRVRVPVERGTSACREAVIREVRRRGNRR